MTLRELLDQWWTADPAGPPSYAERAAAQAELGLLDRVRERKATTSSRLSIEEILEHRDADRR